MEQINTIENVRDSLKYIGPRIKCLRKTKGMTQRELAAKTGITCPAISRIEKGHGVPNIESIQRIATVLETTMSHILDESEESFSLQAIASFIFKKLPSKERKMISDIASLVMETTGQGYLKETGVVDTGLTGIKDHQDIDDVVMEKVAEIKTMRDEAAPAKVTPLEADAKSVGDWPDLLSEDNDIKDDSEAITPKEKSTEGALNVCFYDDDLKDIKHKPSKEAIENLKKTLQTHAKSIHIRLDK